MVYTVRNDLVRPYLIQTGPHTPLISFTTGLPRDVSHGSPGFSEFPHRRTTNAPGDPKLVPTTLL